MFVRPMHCHDSPILRVSYRGGMDFAMSAKAQDYHKRLTAFMTEFVFPAEEAYDRVSPLPQVLRCVVHVLELRGCTFPECRSRD